MSKNIKKRANATRAKVKKPQKRTLIWQTKFIVALREYGSVSKACQRARVQRSTAYRARLDAEAKRKKSDDKGGAASAPAWILYDDFAAKWDEALENATDALELEARRRAVEGVDEPITFQGMVTDTFKRYSDTLLIQLLKAHRPEKYRERHELTGAGGKPLAGAIIFDVKYDDEPGGDRALHDPSASPAPAST